MALSDDHVRVEPWVPPVPVDRSACPFCAGVPGPVIGRVGEAWAVPHRAPALRVEEGTEGLRDGPGWVRPGLGAHEVLIESAHHEPLGEQPVARSVHALLLARLRHQDLRRDDRLRWAGWRRVEGGHQRHPHAEVVALPMLPRDVEAERLWLGAHPHRLQDVVDHERHRGARVVFDDGEVLAWCAQAPAVPFAVRVAVDRAGPTWLHAPDDTLGRVARVVRRVGLALDAALGPHQREVALHQGPLHEPRAPGWWVEIRPSTAVRPSFLGGVVPAHPGWPEAAAARLRAVCHDAGEEEGAQR